MSMVKVIIAQMVIYFLGDPGLGYLSWLGDLKLYIVAAAISLIRYPVSDPGRHNTLGFSPLGP